MNQEIPQYGQQPDGSVIWTLKQTTPNTPDNKYKGVYKLPQSTTNSRLTSVSLVASANPADITAQVRPAATESDPTPAFGA